MPPKKQKMRWDPIKRQLLCCLYRFFECDENQVEEVFSHIFRGHLKESNIGWFVPYDTLQAEWLWMKNGEHIDWIRVHNDAAFEASNDCANILRLIQSAAVSLKLQLRSRNPSDGHTWKLKPALDGDGTTHLLVRCRRRHSIWHFAP